MERKGAVIAVLLVCVVCLLSLVGRFSYTREPVELDGVTLVKTKGDGGLSENEGVEEIPKLTDKEMKGLKKLALFVGHARSCHTFVGSMLNAHPHMHIGVSFNLVTYFKKLGKKSTKEALLQEMYKSALFNRDSTRSKERKGYSLWFDGLYQGTYKDHLDVIGAQRGGGLARLNLNDPEMCEAALAGLRRLTGLPLYLIRVIRNPFDIISTQVLYERRGPGEVHALKTKLKGSHKQYRDPELVSLKAKDYFDMLQSTEEVLRLADKGMDVHCRDLITNPKVVIQKMCDFFEVECPQEYVEKSAAMVFPEESKTSELVDWPTKARDYVTKELSGGRFPYLKRYLDN